MGLLLALPATLVSTSVSRIVGSFSEESCPLTENEEACEEARLESGEWELVDQSPPAYQAVILRDWRTQSPDLRRRAAEQLGRNGCGTALRC